MYRFGIILGAFQNKFPGFSGFGFCRKPHAKKPNNVQTKQANITGIQYFCGLWYCLHSHQQEWCQLCLMVYHLFFHLLTIFANFPFCHWRPQSRTWYTSFVGRSLAGDRYSTVVWIQKLTFLWGAGHCHKFLILPSYPFFPTSNLSHMSS